jgi:hypothetical protein
MMTAMLRFSMASASVAVHSVKSVFPKIRRIG